MPTRYLKPGIRDSEPIDRLRPVTECLFYRLLVTVDDYGRFDARPSMVKAQCFPIKESCSIESCAAMLDELASHGLIALYTIDGKPYLQMQKWDNAPRAKESKYPSITDERAQMHTCVCKPRTLLPETETETETENRKPKPPTGTEIAPEPAAPVATRPRKPRAETPTAATWEAYSAAYAQRYAVDPIRNATLNGQLAQFVGRVGAQEAPAIAAYYLSHNGAFYVRSAHAIGALLRDAEKLRTEWATRSQITATGAQQADRTQTNFNAFAPLLEKARAEARQGAEHAE